MKFFLSGLLISILVGISLFIYTKNIYSEKSIFSINSNYNTYLFSDNSEIIPPKFQYVSLKDVPTDLIFVLLWSEDRDFFGHPGFDLIGLIRSIITNIKSGTSFGGSTLTQQTIKNIYLTHEKSINRKILELFLSFWVERSYTKNEILESYINIAYLGNDINGFGAAAKRYFGKDLKNLNLTEISILVGILNSPEYFNPYKYPLKAKNQGLLILNSLLESQMITNEEYKNYTYILNNLSFKKRTFDENNLQILLAIKSEEANLNLSGGGYIIKSTIDRDLFEFTKNSWEASQSAIVLDNKTGKILSFFGSQYDVFFSNRQIGSTIKPFYYLLALEKGYNFDTKLLDEPFKIGDWTPKNFEKTFKGSVTLKEALINSINIPSIHLFLDLETDPLKSVEKVENFLTDIGIKGYYPHDITISLGTLESNVYNIARAFSIFPNYGIIPKYYIIQEIYDKNGNLIYKKTPQIEKKITYISNKSYSLMNELLESVVKEGTAKNLFINNNNFHGKTGTSDNSVWFSGYDGKINVSVRKDGKFLLSTTHAIPIARTILKNYYYYNSNVKVPKYNFSVVVDLKNSFDELLDVFNNKYYSKSLYIKNIQNYEFLFPDLYLKNYKNVSELNHKLFEFDSSNINSYIKNLDFGDKKVFNDFTKEKFYIDIFFPELYYYIK
ncbi:transglycosylase domain-containing protein [Marinitoga litoralis]|uniref:transglycosylase domain-containing protein n=1 Tax=Marinitoga litoralis TaxID=570855 RepID=UPI00195FDB32|nr:transglycosylase domain-containing protein [Marinitoga litoralis]